MGGGGETFSCILRFFTFIIFVSLFNFYLIYIIFVIFLFIANFQYMLFCSGGCIWSPSVRQVQEALQAGGVLEKETQILHYDYVRKAAKTLFFIGLATKKK